MVNIIPDRSKKRLLIEYYTRVLTVWLYLFASVLFVLTILFLPSIALFNNSLSNFYKENDSLLKGDDADFDKIIETLKKTLKESELVLKEDKIKKISDYVKLFFNLADDSRVKLKLIKTIRSDEGEIEQLIISGLSEDRQRLTKFRDVILQQNEVVAADFPISSLAKSKDINFTLDIKFKTSEHVKK